MASYGQNLILKRAAATILFVAVAVLPLLHAGHADASAPGYDQAEACCVGDCCGITQAGEVAPGCCMDESDQPGPAAPCDDRPCDCPCCGKVLPAISLLPPLPASGLFWDPSPTPSWTPHRACPKSAAVRVDIQPPIV
ncbi:MAG: hypothetical protein AAGA29_06350 [Planctomycetota bacterium]